MAILTTFYTATGWAGGNIVIKSDELTYGNYHDLVLLPEGSVLHLVQLHVRALFTLHGPGDTLIYDINDDTIVVRHETAPSDLILVEPFAGALPEPALFAGINVGQEVAIFSEEDRYFYSSFPGYPYSAAALDGSDRFVFVGNIVQPYASYQPSVNPFQPDSDVDGVPDTDDNCIYMPNGPLLPDTGNNIQLDTDEDGFGNACDADLNDDLIINFLDLNLIRDVFFTNPASPDWNPDADFNGDDFINFADLDLMRSTFFGPPGPSGLVP